MADVLYIVLAIIAILCCILAVFLYLCGITTSITVSTGSAPIGQVKVAYKFAVGPYKDCGSLFQDASTFGPANCKSIGIYYDDPSVVPEKKCRYAVGAILSEDGAPVDQGVEEKMTSNGFQIINLPSVPVCVRTEFPFYNIVSVYLFVWRGYPKISAYTKEHGICGTAYPFVEVYDDRTINFMAPLSLHEDFYVPETKDHIPEEYAKMEKGNKFVDSQVPE